MRTINATADRLARLGLDTEFRQPLPSASGDAFVDGLMTDLKNVTTANENTFIGRVGRKAAKQGGRTVVDITNSELTVDTAARWAVAALSKYDALLLVRIVKEHNGAVQTRVVRKDGAQ